MTDKKTIAIGGITGGIGSVLARELVAVGHHVTGFARNKNKIDEINGVLGTEAVTCDAEDPNTLSSSMKQFAEKHGQIDAYVHAIGSIFLKPAHLTSPEDFGRVLQANLVTAFNALRVCTSIMQKQNGGNCLFFSTAAARVGIANHEAIAAAKGGIEALVRSAAASYSSRGLRFNAIAPSLTDTPLAKSILNNEQALEISKRMHPLGRIGEMEDVASLAAWLISDEAKFVTGQIFVMDGGISSIVPKPKA